MVIRRPIIGAVLVVVAMMAAGCSASISEEPVHDPASVGRGASVVHGPEGKQTPMDFIGDTLPVFEQRFVANRSAGEPTLGVDTRGHIFYESLALDGPGGNVRSEIYRSSDWGINWAHVSPRLAGLDSAPVSLDQYLHVDPVTDRVFFMHTYLGCMAVYWTDDLGETWGHSLAACGTPLVWDHQTLWTGPPATVQTIGYPNVVHICGDQLMPTVMCTSSLDGGLTWRPATLAYATPEWQTGFGPEPWACAPYHGHGAADPETGRLFIPRVYCGQVIVTISDDDGLTWRDVVVAPTDETPFPADRHEASIGVDPEGNAYIFWHGGDTLPRMAVSRDRGDTWGPAVGLWPPGINVARFPTAIVGDAGRVAWAFIGANVTDGYDGDFTDARWDYFVGMTLDALSENPSIVTTRVNEADDPVRIGTCWHRDCGMVDFLDIQIHPTDGRIVAAMVDSCWDETSCTQTSNLWIGRGAVGVQTDGPSLKAVVAAERAP